MESLRIDSGGASLRVRLHPVVLFSILDHYIRRQEGQSRVIGTLLGSVHAGVVDIRNCFGVTHGEKDTVAIGKDLHHTMTNLNRKVNPGEQIVGWYATTLNDAPISEFSCLIHDFYTSEVPNAVHLVVDTSLRQPRLTVKAFVSRPMPVASQTVVKFEQVEVVMQSSEAERIGVGMMLHSDRPDNERKFDIDDRRVIPSRACATTLTDELDGLEVSITKLLNMLDTVSGYVDDIVEGKREPDVGLGRRIAQALASVPRMDERLFEKMFNDSLQDLLMVVYLAQLTQTQLAIAEKLNTRV